MLITDLRFYDLSVGEKQKNFIVLNVYLIGISICEELSELFVIKANNVAGRLYESLGFLFMMKMEKNKEENWKLNTLNKYL